MTKAFKPFKVYRLENAEGRGPFTGGDVADTQPLLRDHTAPEILFELMGYPKPMLKLLCRLGFVYGWRTREMYRHFFRPGGQAACRKLGYRCKVYEPAVALTMPDNQVLFLKDVQVSLMHQHGSLGVTALGGLLHALSQPLDRKGSENILDLPLTDEVARKLINSIRK